MGKKLYGHVTKENVEYEWKTEPGACEVCQGMNGKIYESANDIPDRPHPNCLGIQAFTKTQRFRSHGAFLSVSPA